MANREENLKKINAELEKLSDEELEKVAGGTVGELEDLTGAMLSNWSVLEKFGKGAAHVPGTNHLLAREITNILKNDLEISADIDLGWGGTGMGSGANTYKDISTGRKLSHGEVLDRIKNADKRIL